MAKLIQRSLSTCCSLLCSAMSRAQSSKRTLLYSRIGNVYFLVAIRVLANGSAGNGITKSSRDKTNLYASILWPQPSTGSILHLHETSSLHTCPTGTPQTSAPLPESPQSHPSGERDLPTCSTLENPRTPCFLPVQASLHCFFDPTQQIHESHVLSMAETPIWPPDPHVSFEKKRQAEKIDCGLDT